jgi:hypothetical protein
MTCFQAVASEEPAEAQPAAESVAASAILDDWHHEDGPRQHRREQLPRARDMDPEESP